MNQKTKLTITRAIIRLIAFAVVAFTLYSAQGFAGREITVYKLSNSGDR